MRCATEIADFQEHRSHRDQCTGILQSQFHFADQIISGLRSLVLHQGIPGQSKARPLERLVLLKSQVVQFRRSLAVAAVEGDFPKIEQSRSEIRIQLENPVELLFGRFDVTALEQE